MRVYKVVVSFLLLVAVFGCGSKQPPRQRVLLPPTLNLLQYRDIGLFQFSVENAKGSLHEFATRRFEEFALAAQAGIEMRGYTVADSARVFNGDTTTVPVAFFGHLKISNVKPSGGLVSLVPNLEATVTCELSVWLVNTRTGGTLWRRSSMSTEKVGGLSFLGSTPSFSARDPNEAYGELVNRLVRAVTYDLRSTWVDQ